MGKKEWSNLEQKRKKKRRSRQHEHRNLVLFLLSLLPSPHILFYLPPGNHLAWLKINRGEGRGARDIPVLHQPPPKNCLVGSLKSSAHSFLAFSLSLLSPFHCSEYLVGLFEVL